MKKYLLSIICTLLPIFASAQEPYAVLTNDGETMTLYYDNNRNSRDGILTLDVSDMYLGEKWSGGYLPSYVKTVIFDSSFANYTTLTSTEWWFSGFGITSVEGLEYLNTSNVTNMEGMFNSCNNLTSLDVNYFNTSNVTNMSYMFQSCESLESIYINNFDTSNVTDMNSMFYQCINLTTINVGTGWSTSNVLSSTDMFQGCTRLVGSNGTTYDSSHTDASYAHIDGGSSYPGYLSGEGGGGSSEEAQYWMELESTLQYADDVYARARDNSNVEQWMLEELSHFMNRGSDMLDAHEADEEEVRHMIEEINYICWEIEEAMNREPEPSGEAEPYAVLSENNTVLTFYYDTEKAARGGMDIGPFSIAEYRPWHSLAEGVYSVIFDESLANCTTITSTCYWFFEFVHLDYIGGLEYLNTSNVTNMANMFYNCFCLTSLDLSNFNTSNVTSMSGMFSGCSGLTSLDLSNFNTSNVTDMDWMFYCCWGLTSLDLSNFNTSNVTNMALMFDNCSGLTSLDLSNFNTSSVTDMGAMFSGCSGLTSLDLSNFNTSSVTDMGAMFSRCSGLTSLDLSNFNTSNVIYIADMFSACSGLTTIYVGNEWGTSNNFNYGTGIFTNCTSLVGGAGTTYDENHVDYTYAHIDGGINNPGYLTGRNAEPTESEARFDGLTAWVYGDATLDDAFAEVGRESAVQTIAAIVWEGTGALTAEQMQGITNPNLLVYVNDASKAPAGVRNVIVNGTAANITLSDASGNNNFFCPEPFTAQSISYTRNFSQTTEIGVSRGWETIALPFNVQSISHGSHGALVPFGGGNGGYPFWLHQLLSNGLTPVTAMEANTPYLICMPNNTVYPSAYNQAGSVTFASSNVTVPRTEPREAFGANVILMPAFQNLSAGSDIFTLNVGAARDSYAEGSVFISNYSDVRPFQAYVHHSNQARGTDDIQFIPLTSIGGGDDTTAIMEIIQPAANGTGDWYSLDGRKLSSKPTQKGIYIQNGKKIVIK